MHDDTFTVAADRECLGRVLQSSGWLFGLLLKLRAGKSNHHKLTWSRMLQVSPQDCTGCSLCVSACAEGSLTMAPLAEELVEQVANWRFARALPER